MNRVLLLLFLLAGSAVATPATDLLNAGNYARAYETALQASDELTASTAALAQVLFESPNDRALIDRAIAAAQSAVQTNPNSPLAHLNLSGAYGMKANISGLSFAAFKVARDSRAEAERSIALNPQFPEGIAALARWHAGAYAKAGRISGGNPDTARKLAAQALNMAPNNVRVWVDVGTVLSDLKDTRNARAVLEKAIALPPQNAMDKDRQNDARHLLARLK